MKRWNRPKIALVAVTFLAAGWLATCFAAEPAEKNTADFPYDVKFEQGAAKFADGDSITITEVRGTADTIKPGNIYCIKGRCKLASHDKAMLAAYVTAKNADDAKSKTLTVQKATVNKGDGSFTLYMPMYIEGWPHVSFYPPERGESFGGNYFGNGEYTLKQWWAEKPTDKVAK